MSNSSAPRFSKPAVWVLAIAGIAIAITAGSVKYVSVQKAQGRPSRVKSAGETARLGSDGSRTVSAEQQGRIRASLDALPLAFEANQGQTDPQVKYTARGNRYSVFLTANDAVFAVSSTRGSKGKPSPARGVHGHRMTAEDIQTAAIDMHLVGANSKPEVLAGTELPGVVNYYVGSDPKNWQTGVKQYSSVRYPDVYPGVNMVFHGAQRQMEFDFIVAAGADPRPIELGFKGARKVRTDDGGDLILTSSAGDVVLHRPVAYQQKDGKREPVEVAFRMQGRDQVGLQLGAYDRGRELVIDPTLSYATYLGGSGEDEIFGIAVDGSGNMYVAGQMNSPNFPAHIGTVSSLSSSFDAFVTRISASGTSVDFTTVIGGTGTDSALGVAVSGSGVYAIGNTASATFPSTVSLGPTGGQDAFVASLNSTTGTATYITRIGGTGTESGNAIAVDSSGNAYIGGETDSIDFPTAAALYSTNAGTDDGFIAKLNPAGSALLFSTYIGGSSGDLVTAVALDSSNNVYAAGITVSSDFPTTTGVLQTTGKGGGDGFVSEVKTDGSALVYSTYLGGTGADNPLGIAVDSAGEAFITGYTDSTDYPTANAAQSSNGGANDVFLTKLNAGGTALVFSTYYGGTLDDMGTSVALDTFGDAYVTGRTLSSNYPANGAPFQNALSGTSDAFITEFSNTGFVVYSSFFGGTGTENSLAGDNTQAPIGGVAVDSSGNAYIAGGTASTTGLMVTSPLPCCAAFAGGLSDGFVAKVGPAPADFSVALSANGVSTTSGQTTAAVTVTVSSVNSSFGQAVTLSCGGLPAKAVCHFSPSSVTPGTTAQTSSLTIATNGSSNASLALTHSDRNVRSFAAFLLPVFGIALVGAGIGPRRKRIFGFLMLGVMAAGLMILPACGGSSGGGGGGGGGGTTPGTYGLTVSGTAGASSHSAGLTLTVN